MSINKNIRRKIFIVMLSQNEFHVFRLIICAINFINKEVEL